MKRHAGNSYFPNRKGFNSRDHDSVSFVKLVFYDERSGFGFTNMARIVTKLNLLF
jgi:hypothetical protein